ncbi:MAG: hypothetical protein ACI8TP_004006 [Acidimicrobiales bacterium]|jgi:hypothetical protein
MTSLEFAELARRLSAAARQQGYEPPQFRSPPRTPGTDRSLSRKADGSTTVSVRLKDRPSFAVAGDMIDGVLASNRLAGGVAGQQRDLLWSAAEDLLRPLVIPHLRAA